MHSEIIASYELIARKGVDSPYPVRVLLGKPVQSTRMAPAWSCEVTVEPLWSKPFEIYGDGSLQALCLGAKHAVQMLAIFIEQGGILEYREGEAFDPGVFGFRLLPPIGEAGDA